MHTTRTYLAQFLVLSIALTLALGANYLYAAWSGPPSGTPPTCPAGYAGCDAPINVGATTQTKTGNLTVAGLTSDVLSVLGNSSIVGKLRIGASGTPAQLLDLRGTDGVDGIRFPNGSVQYSAADGAPPLPLIKDIGAMGAGPGVTKNFGKAFSLIDFIGSRKMSGGTFGSNWQAPAGGYIYKRTNGTFVAYITFNFVNGGHNLDTTEWCASGGSYAREWCFQLDVSGNVIVSMPLDDNLKVHYVVFN